jgi:protein arginine kinase activator
MLCQKCSQAEATVHLTSLVLGMASEAHLCAKCATEAGIVLATPIAQVQGMLQQALLAAGELSAKLDGAQRRCPHCGITLDDIRRTGRLGCPLDYEVFADVFSEFIDRAHAGARHVGKIPPSASPETRLAVLGARADQLRARLNAAVLREEYELAAGLRDQLAAVEAEARRAGGAAGLG